MKVSRLMIAALLILLMPYDESRAGTNQVFSQAYLCEVMRHLYRWHLDETALLTLDDTSEIEVWVKSATPKLDEGDLSQYYEVLIPRISYRLLLKKADYTVPEMKLHVENRDFRIVRAEKLEGVPPRESFDLIRMPKRETIEYLFATRNKSEYPDLPMMERMRKALREQLGSPSSPAPLETQTFYIAPLSPVANELWVYWETGGKIIRFSSDTDLMSRAFWEYEKLGARIYDLKGQVVVSLAETAGSNAFVTRDWAARVLFNCVVFGKRLEVVPEADISKPVKAKEVPVFRP